MAKHRSKERRRRAKLRALRAVPRPVPRRRFLLQGVFSLMAGAALSWRGLTRVDRRASAQPTRPPTASVDDLAFQQACVRCGLCGTVCENGCIRFFNADEQTVGAFTPYLDVRERSCTLCMRCTNICPSGALKPTPARLPVIAQRVRMGKAVVDPEHCISYLGRLCGYCHDACPLPGEAIKLVPRAIPVVLDGCVGCGRCVEQCPQTPTAIRLVNMVPA